MARPISAPPTFYAAIEPFLDFAEVADPARYRAAPDDWIVVLADIKGSTEAAKAGRYKDVNLIGAACITAILNVDPGARSALRLRRRRRDRADPAGRRKAWSRTRCGAPGGSRRAASASSFGSAWCRSRS